MKKKHFILLTMAAAVVAIALVFILKVGSDKEKSIASVVVNKEIIFANQFISSGFDSASGFSANIFGVKKVKEGQQPIKDAIQSVNVDNNYIDAVVNDVSSADAVYKGYRLFNMMLSFYITGEGSTETARSLNITFSDGEQMTYDIGRILLQRNDETNSDIGPKGGYTVGYPRPELSVGLENTSNRDLTLNSISDLTNNVIVYHFGKGTVFPVKEKQEFNINKISFQKEYDFYTLTPILNYTKEGKKYNYMMPTVVYGAALSDEEKVNLILGKQKEMK